MVGWPRSGLMLRDHSKLIDGFASTACHEAERMRELLDLSVHGIYSYYGTNYFWELACCRREGADPSRLHEACADLAHSLLQKLLHQYHTRHTTGYLATAPCLPPSASYSGRRTETSGDYSYSPAFSSPSSSSSSSHLAGDQADMPKRKRGQVNSLA